MAVSPYHLSTEGRAAIDARAKEIRRELAALRQRRAVGDAARRARTARLPSVRAVLTLLQGAR